MQRQALWVCAFTGALGVLAPRTLSADIVCGGNAFATCASVQVSKVLLPNGHVRIVMQVANLSGSSYTWQETVFSGIALWGLPDSARYVDGSLVVDGSATADHWWLGHEGLTSELRQQVRGVTLRPGTFAGLRSGQKATFRFDLRGTTLEQIDERDWVILGRGPNDACATQLISTDGRVNQGAFALAACTALVPEPASVILVATGLLGLAGGGLRMRRRADVAVGANPLALDLRVAEPLALGSPNR